MSFACGEPVELSNRACNVELAGDEGPSLSLFEIRQSFVSLFAPLADRVCRNMLNLSVTPHHER
jgi:hypothetical protein